MCIRDSTEIIRARHTRNLGTLHTTDIVRWDTPQSKAILTAYCRCVATRWRTSSIIAGQQYKSTKMIDTIKQAFLEHLSFFAAVKKLQNGQLVMDRPSFHSWAFTDVIDA